MWSVFVSNLCELKGPTAPNPVSSYFLSCPRLQMTSVRVDMLLIISDLLLVKEAITQYFSYKDDRTVSKMVGIKFYFSYEGVFWIFLLLQVVCF